MSEKLKTGAILGLLCFLTFTVWGQNITETHWYFGNASENFVIDKSGRTASLETNQGTPFGMGGSAVIVDQQKGNLLFYSDGQRVYDATHALLPAIAGGTLMGGDPTINQPVVASAFPDSTDRYYFFTNDGSQIAYSIVDASVPGNPSVAQFPKGDVTSFNQAFGVNNPSEGMTIIQSADRERFWLLSQDRNSFAFRITEIDSLGIGATTLFNVFPGSIPGFEAVQFAVLGDTLIAAAPKGANRNVMIMNFDNQTGTLTYNRSVQNTGFADASPTVIFDVEWSNDGSKLYVSRTGDGTNPGNIYQVDLADTVNIPIPVNQVLQSPVFASYGLRKGIDGRIYHLYQLNNVTSPYRLGRINQPDSAATGDVVYDSLVFDVDFNGRQFPQFAPAYVPTDYFSMDFTFFDNCLNNTTKFVALVDPLPQNYFWSFGDGSTGVGPAPIHEYQASNSYPVTLVVSSNGLFQTFTQPVGIAQIDSADLGNDTTICVDEILTLDPGVTGDSYVWSTGEITQTIDVDTAGTYWVEITVAGCTTFGDIEVTEYGVTSQDFNQWYFGEMAGLDFSLGAPIPITDANMMFSPEGCATISDLNGDLLFYTNGSTVWNKEHNIMLNGDNIGGDSTAAQSAMIVPFTGDNTLFYIFTTEEVYGDFSFQGKMSIVDIKGDTARGEVMVKNIPIIECSTERITATGFVGTPILMAHEYGNNSFRAYQISDLGLIGPSYSYSGETHSFENDANATGYMKFGPALTLLATVVPDNPNYVELFDFDINTGEVSNSRLIDIMEPGSTIYGMEFSGASQRLYITTTGVNSKLLQYDLDSLNSENPAVDIQATKFEYPGGLANYGALQMGPDGVIYMAVDGQTDVGSIGNPDGDDLTAGFLEQSGVTLAGRISRLGLPNFTQQVNQSPQQPGISTTIACAGQTTLFSGQGRDSSIETYQWNFGDGASTSVLSSPDTSHVFTTPGTYIVELTLSNRCDVDTVLSDTIEVFTIPELPMVPEDTALCGGSVVLEAWDVDRPDLSYYWSTGDTTRTVTFFSPAIVDVAIINSSGCSSDTLTVFVADNETFIDLGPDRLLCQYDTVVLDANVAGTVFNWTQDGIVVGDQRTQTVNTSSSGVFEYAVEFTNTFTGCIYRDTVELTIQGAPTVAQANIVPPACSMSNGSFQLAISSTGSFSYDLEGPVSDGPFTFDGPGTTPAFSNLPSGTYTSRVTNTVNGCTNTQVLQLENDAPFDIEAVPLNDCARTSDISINILNTLPAAVDINVYNASGFNVFSSTENLVTRTFVVEDLDSGRYFVEVRDVAPPNCIQTDTVTLSVTDECFRRIFVPNAFSPNGNAQNEEFFAFPNQFIESFEIYIYNRWGDLVFYSNNKDFRWDGTFQGTIASSGTFAYKMLFTSSLEPEAGTLEQYGSVTVIR